MSSSLRLVTYLHVRISLNLHELSVCLFDHPQRPVLQLALPLLPPLPQSCLLLLYRPLPYVLCSLLLILPHPCDSRRPKRIRVRSASGNGLLRTGDRYDCYYICNYRCILLTVQQIAPGQGCRTRGAVQGRSVSLDQPMPRDCRSSVYASPCLLYRTASSNSMQPSRTRRCTTGSRTGGRSRPRRRNSPVCRRRSSLHAPRRRPSTTYDAALRSVKRASGLSCSSQCGQV